MAFPRRGGFRESKGHLLMANKREVLKVHCLSLPQVATEWGSILGDKYRSALPFDVELTDDPKEAQVIAWDGIIGKKLESLMPAITELLKDKVLLLTGESSTLVKEMRLVRSVQLESSDNVELPGWTVLPENILASLQVCWEKLKRV